MSQWREFGGVNEGYVLELFERWQRDPSSVDEATRAAFEQASPDFADDRRTGAADESRTEVLLHGGPVGQDFSPARGLASPVGQDFSPAQGLVPPVGQDFSPARGLTPALLKKVVGAVNLAESIRKYGHLGAQLDPLGTPPWGDPSLAPE